MTKYFFISLLLFFVQNGMTQEAIPVEIGQSFTLYSEILQEERNYMVSLPASYEGDHFYRNKKYPILIILDGERLFPVTSTMVQSMSSGGIEQIPEMIVVGITNVNRNRDFLPDFLASDTTQLPNFVDGADRFLQFLEKELIPTIQQKYRSLDTKILVGHSFGGLFAVNTLLKQGDFDAYLAIDPSLWWQEEGVIRRFQKIDSTNSLITQLYVSQSNNPFNQGITNNRLGRAVQNYKAVVAKNKANNIRSRFDFFEKEDHFSIPLISLYEGLQFLFDGYKFPLQEIRATSIADLKTHYQKVAHRFGGYLLPPGKLLNQVGLFLLNSENEVDKAIELFAFNVQNYSNVATPLNSLGSAYEQAGEIGLAIENYAQSLAINGENEQIRTRLERLRNN